MSAHSADPAQTLPAGAPLVAQFIAALAPRIADEIRALPVTSARYRFALRAAAAEAGWPLQPTRNELARGAAYLARLEETT